MSSEFHLPELLSLMGTLVSGLGLFTVVLKIWTKKRATRLARERLHGLKKSGELAMIAKNLRKDNLDPIEREKILKQIETLLHEGLDRKSLMEVNESLYQRSSRGRVRYAESLLSKSAATK